MTKKDPDPLKKLYSFSQLLSRNNIKHWLDWGFLLHAYRDKKILVDIENDVDLGLLKQDWDKVKQLLKDNNIEFSDNCYKDSLYDGLPVKPNQSLLTLWQYLPYLHSNGKTKLQQIDLYFWDPDPNVSDLPDTFGHKRYEMLRAEIMCAPHSALFCQGVDLGKPNKYLRLTKKYFIQELDTLDVGGYDFPVPRYLEKFLVHRYGIRWRTSMTKQEHDIYITDRLEEQHFIKEGDITVLVEGVWDLFHQGHLELLKRVHNTYDRVIVGIASDDLVRSYKRDPIIPYDDRVNMLEACKYVDEIYHNAPVLNITEDILNKCGAHYSLHSVNDPINWKTELRQSARYDQSLIDSGRAHFLSYTDYHTTDIIDKILKNNK